jgi:hypothetical protein
MVQRAKTSYHSIKLDIGLVIKRRKSIYHKSIIKTLTNSTKSASCPMPCRWGKQNETEALKQYVSHKQNSVNVCSLCGFVVDKTSPWLRASPDFLIHDSSEVGEPSSARTWRNQMSILQAREHNR